MARILENSHGQEKPKSTVRCGEPGRQNGNRELHYPERFEAHSYAKLFYENQPPSFDPCADMVGSRSSRSRAASKGFTGYEWHGWRQRWGETHGAIRTDWQGISLRLPQGAQLHNANFVSVEVPQGAVSIASIAAVNILFHFPPAAHWASGPGCTNVNWRRLFEVSSAAAEPCDNELRDWIRKCSEEFGPLRRGCALEIGPMEEARSLLRLAVEPEAPPLSYFRNVHDSRERLTRVKADMQAGKAYYFRWSIPYAPFQAAKAPQLELVDDATGAKEVSRLRRAER